MKKLTYTPDSIPNQISVGVFILPVILIFSFSLLLSVCPLAKAEPIPIEDIQGLQNMRNDLHGEFFLVNDIHAGETENWNNGEGFRAIGDDDHPFTGTFDGRGYCISNLYINGGEEYRAGLFGVISRATIENVGMIDVNFSTENRAGGLVAWSYLSTVANCYATGNINGRGSAGGLVGYLPGGSITNSYAAVNVSGSSRVGGLVADFNQATISNCYAIGNVVGGFSVGGLIGYIYAGTVNNSYATGSVEGGRLFGGLIGEIRQGSFNRTFWDIETSGNDQGTGSGNQAGITGLSTAEMRRQANFDNAGWDFDEIWVMRGYPHFQWEVEVIEPVLMGTILDAANDQPLEGALVATSYGVEVVTDEDGWWLINPVRRGPFDLTVRLAGYNDSILVNLEVALNDTLEVNVAMLHPEMELSDLEITHELASGDYVELPLFIRNNGNGVLGWQAAANTIGESGYKPWAIRKSIPVTEITGDNQILGAIYDGESFYCSGVNENNAHLIYRFDRDGALLDSFPQPGHGLYGFKDLEWDSELIWCAGEDTIWALNRNGEVVRHWLGPVNISSVIAWDPAEEILWIGGTITYLTAFDRDGNRLGRTLNRQGLRMYGLACCSRDHNGSCLYVLNRPIGDSLQVVSKIDTQTGELSTITTLAVPAGTTLNGAYIFNNYDSYGSLVWLHILNQPDSSGGDRLEVRQLWRNDEWLRITPDSGLVEPGDEEQLTVTICTITGDGGWTFPVGNYEGEIIFTHDDRGSDVVLPIIIELTEPSRFGDGKQAIPSTFEITDCYPNPFNSATRLGFTLPTESRIKLNVYDITGRQVLDLVAGRLGAGAHVAVFNGESLCSGVYFVNLESEDSRSILKVTLLR